MDRISAMRSAGVLALVLVLVHAGCGDDEGPSGGGDSGPAPMDSGSAGDAGDDAGGEGEDAGGEGEDAGGEGEDAGGTLDAGGGDEDAGPMCGMAMQSCTSRACCAGLECCSGVPVPPGAEYCSAGPCPMSDRNVKHGFESVDPESVLARVAALEVSEWSYDFEHGGVRHMGPMAQDFHAAFGLGADDRHIHVIDSAGVTLAAIQALEARTRALAEENRALRARNDALAAEIRRAIDRLDAAR